MKPASFEYLRATSLDEALAALGDAGDDATVLAGGQSLIPLLNLRMARPALLVDINRVTELDHVIVDDGAVAVGAIARASAVELDPAVAGALPVLTTAIGHIAHPQIRVRTTVGGNIAHADPASELPAVLAALDGSVDLARVGACRTLSAAEFFEGAFTTARQPDELVVGVTFPVPPGIRWRFLELARRHGDYGMVSACIGLHVEDGHVVDSRLAFAGCGPVPVRAHAAEKALLGATASAALARAASEAVRDVVEPADDVHASAEYRRALAGVLVERAITSLVKEAR